MTSLAQSLADGAKRIGAIATGPALWSGPAADSFHEHAVERSKVVMLLAEVAGQAAPVLTTYANAIDASQYAYSVAANTEVQARPYLPATFAVVEAAMAGEVAAIVSLSVAGTVFAAELTALMLKAEAADNFAITRNPYEVVRDGVNDLVDTWNSDDWWTSITRGANTTGRTENSDGTVTQSNRLGQLLSAAAGPLLKTLEVLGGVVGLMNAKPLTARQANDELRYLQSHGFKLQPGNALDLGIGLEKLEDFRRKQGVEPDQSAAIPYQIGRAPNGQRVITLHVPGIVPPGDGSINGDSGPRNVSMAALSKVTGLGPLETAIRQQLENLDVRPGDKVVLYGHSYGGIVARNVANGLAREKISSAFVSYGSPDGHLEKGVEAYMVQNPNDPVPATRVGGDGMEGVRFMPQQHVILVHQRATGDVFNNHAARFYGENLTQTPNLELQAFLRQQNLVKLTGSGMVIYEGSKSPSGNANTGSEPYRLPAPVSR